jgi:hypothetical protein
LYRILSLISSLPSVLFRLDLWPSAVSCSKYGLRTPPRRLFTLVYGTSQFTCLSRCTRHRGAQKASKSVSSLAVDTCSVVMVLIVFSNFYLDPSDAQSWYLLGRACMAGQNATKPTKRINRPCTEMGATQHFSGRSTFSTSKSTSSVTPLTLIHVRSE